MRHVRTEAICVHLPAGMSGPLHCQFMVLSAHYLNSTNIGGKNRELLSLDLEKINKKVINGLYRLNYD